MTYESYTNTLWVNGTSLFYAVEGCGKPIILLHGNGGSHNDLETTIHQMAQSGYKVFAIDSRGQGANAPLDEYHYADMAEDVFQFIQALNLERPAVFGWSDGGIIALELELYNPGTVSMLAISGANITPDGIGKETYQQMFGGCENPAPLTRMMMYEPNISPERLQRIQCPVLVMAGERDLIQESHTRLIAENLPAGELYIVPGHDHGSHIYHNVLLGNLLLPFLKKNGF